ncbi:MAG: c-type cytochrome biogenesis protein CcmI [Rhodospirillaceae bacterium]|nr:c-type cytochrome biogenesis protein CcmI [Rhodospirillaceae bacterium]
MILWILAAVITAGVVAAVIKPLAAPPPGADDPADHDVEVYRAQLAELEQDRARGVVDPSEAEATRLEIARRLLAADRRRGREAAEAPPQKQGRPLAWALAAVIPLATLGGYLMLGDPELPSQPLALRDPGERQAVQQRMAEVEALSQALRDNPGDLAGWVELGRRLSQLGRYADAAEAFGRAVGLSEGSTPVVGAYGQALVDAADGTVTPPAVAAFQQVLDDRPDDARARYYLALAEAQAGNAQAALDGWAALLADSPADAPWVEPLRQQIAAMADELGLDPAEVTPEPAPPAETAGMGPAPGVDPDQAAAIANLSPEDQALATRGMVDRLAARLEDAPDDVAGWLQLANSYRALGEEELSVTALGRAAEAAPDDPEVLRAYADGLLRLHGADLPPEFLATIEALHALDPDDPRALWVLGNRAAGDGDTETALDLLGRLRDQLPEGGPERGLVEERIEALSGS